MACSLVHDRPELDSELEYSTSKSRRVAVDVTEAVYRAIKSGDSEKALELLASGEFKPGFRNGRNRSVLQIAIFFRMPEVAIALINTGNSEPNHYLHSEHTPLISACAHHMEDVALALIATGKSKPYVHCQYGCTAIGIAKTYRLTKVVAALASIGVS